jgi:hypothetical protein
MGKLRTWKCALKISWLRWGGLEYSAVVRLDSHPTLKRILTRRWVTVTPDSEWDYHQTMKYVSSSTKLDSHSDIKCDSPSLPRIPHSRDPIFARPRAIPSATSAGSWGHLVVLHSNRLRSVLTRKQSILLSTESRLLTSNCYTPHESSSSLPISACLAVHYWPLCIITQLVIQFHRCRCRWLAPERFSRRKNRKFVPLLLSARRRRAERTHRSFHIHGNIFKHTAKLKIMRVKWLFMYIHNAKPGTGTRKSSRNEIFGAQRSLSFFGRGEERSAKCDGEISASCA